MKHTLWLALLAACGGHVTEPRSTAVTVPFEWIDNRIFVAATLDGRPVHALLDTGAVAAVSTDTARALGLRVAADTSGEGGVGVGSQRVESGIAHVGTISIGGAVAHDVDVDVIPLGDSTQVFGKAPVDAIIGKPIFDRYVTTIDFVHRTVTFGGAVPAGVRIPFDVPEQIPLITATLDGVTGRFGVDIGARSSLLVYRPFADANHLADKYSAKLEGVTGWGIGGPVRSLLARAHELDLGGGSGASVHDLVIRLSTQTAGATTSSSKAGLIGPDVLSQFDVTFDYARHVMLLTPNASYGRADAYDRAGVWMGLAPDARAFVAVDVIAGGPADAAGLHAGDRIVAIDGVATEQLVLPDVRERMRRTAPGTAVTLTLDGGREVVVTLRDLV
nr:aspartyl protease family protein [Kofleriaceae bacterium]